jgi:ribonucleoside-triphosphate reductase
MKCDETMEVYSRVVGYYRPVQNWNKGKQEEFNFRKNFDLHKSLRTNEMEEGDTLVLDVFRDE